MLLLGACSEGADIGIMNPQSFSESYKLPTRSVLVFFFKTNAQKHVSYKNTYDSLYLQIYIPNKPWVLGGRGPVLPRDATFDQLHSHNLRGFLDFAEKTARHFLDETGNLLGKGVG